MLMRLDKSTWDSEQKKHESDLIHYCDCCLFYYTAGGIQLIYLWPKNNFGRERRARIFTL